jgi:dTDP-4-amino-4,6-dideoxygalactose transaminase
MDDLLKDKIARLAIEGGRPIRDRPMPARRAIGDRERAMITEVLDYYAEQQLDPGYQGVFEQRYCEAFAAHMGGGYADAVATGTAALYVSLAALDLPRGSEVLVSPITDPGTLSAIILLGLVPRLVDSRRGSYNVGVEEVRARLTAKTACVLIVHSIGSAAEIDAITALAQARGIKVLEDCSQSHGALRNGQQVGTFGDIAAYSTMYRKASMTGGSGGVVYTRDREVYRRALAHADRGKPRWMDGFDDRNPSQFLFPALNFHSDEISCAIGLASIARLEDTRQRRLRFVTEVARLIAEESKVCLPYEYSDQDSPFIFPVIVDTARISTDKVAFARAVLAEGIGLNPHYNYLVADWPWVRPYLSDAFDTPNARWIRDHSFNLYLNENYGPTEAADTVEAIRKVERAYA